MNWATPNSSAMPSTAANEAVVPASTRKALVWALRAYLSAPEAEQAADLWQPGPSAQGTAIAGLSRYCRAVARQFSLAGREAELHLRIIRAMQTMGQGATLPEESLTTEGRGGAMGSRVDSLDSRVNTSANDSVPPGLPVVAVQRFLEAMEQVAARECPDTYSPTVWRQSLLIHAKRIPQHLRVHAADWLWGRSTSLNGDWPARGAGTRLINTAYVTLAEWVGPVRADACFTAIVREFENSQDPALADVRRYL